MKSVKKLLNAAVFSSVVFASAFSQAATVAVTPSASTVNVGDNVQVTLVGRDWTDGQDGTYGGGVSLAWNASVLQLVSYDTSVFGGDQFLATAGITTSVNNTTGTLSNLAVNSLFSGVYTPNFDIAVLNFTAVGFGQSDLIASLGKFNSGFDNIWTDAADGSAVLVVNPDFVKGEISAVPLPAAVYLLGTALLGLAGFTRRKIA
ncbi:MAG: VPLPA-CTERM sorting domain-containing protein [Moraxellaceae bacterium]|jgi:hypothetical protein|nr:MAG: VPLPA-CTERM sorting domain-containing protein [Moraxellaceae bacterium]